MWIYVMKELKSQKNIKKLVQGLKIYYICKTHLRNIYEKKK